MMLQNKRWALQKYFYFSILFFLSHNLYAQNYYTTLGNSENLLHWVFRVEIVDDQTHLPVVGATITITEESFRRNIVKLSTDGAGVGVIFVRNPNFIPDIGKINILAAGYRFDEKIIYHEDFAHNEYKFRLFLLYENIIWDAFSTWPDDSELARKVRDREYEIWNNPEVYYDGPPIYEFSFNLKKVPSKIEIE